MANKKEIEEKGGYYTSSCLPKAFLVPPSPVYFRSRENFRESKRKENLKKELKKKVYEIKPHTVGIDFKECLPVEGRQHLSVQTDLYLEEICDVVEEVDAQTETDPMLDRPSSPLSIPIKLGVDATTQIYPREFDCEEIIGPTLEALDSQAYNLSEIEIVAEKELAKEIGLAMNLEMKRKEELKRLEEEEWKMLEEKQKQLKEQEEAIALDNEVAQKIAASIFSQNYLSELVPQVYEKLEAAGYFEIAESESNEVEDNFWAWLLNEVDSEIATLEASSDLLENLIQDASKTSETIKPEMQEICLLDEEQVILKEEQDVLKQDEEVSNIKL